MHLAHCVLMEAAAAPTFATLAPTTPVQSAEHAIAQATPTAPWDCVVQQVRVRHETVRVKTSTRLRASSDTACDALAVVGGGQCTADVGKCGCTSAYEVGLSCPGVDAGDQCCPNNSNTGTNNTCVLNGACNCEMNGDCPSGSCCPTGRHGIDKPPLHAAFLCLPTPPTR